MTLYLLDTDTVSFVLSNHPLTAQRLRTHQNESAIAIVTVHEVFNGWVSRINSAKQLEEVIFLYNQLSNALKFFQGVLVLDFDGKAASRFQSLIQNTPELNKNKLQKDIRIAAIALANNAIVITRNHRDFSLVPGLTIVDWTVP
jgi:tRNA(fMet)-specific endonuclease VapC